MSRSKYPEPLGSVFVPLPAFLMILQPHWALSLPGAQQALPHPGGSQNLFLLPAALFSPWLLPLFLMAAAEIPLRGLPSLPSLRQMSFLPPHVLSYSPCLIPP